MMLCRMHGMITRRPLKAQHGAVLMFSLIVLILLTLIGLAAMQTTVLQERMAGGQRDRQLAFQGAEAALKEAERRLNTAVLPDFHGQGGRYDEFNPNYALNKVMTDDNVIDWDATLTAATVSQYQGSELNALLAEPPDYLMERLPPAARLGGALESDVSVADEEVFRVTARSTGGSGRSTVIIQLIFRR